MLSGKVLQMLYFSYVHSTVSYGIIFWSNTPNSIEIFRKGEKIIIITNSKKTLLFYSQSIFSLLLYVVNNKHLFALQVHNHDTRSANNFHVPITNSAKY